MSQKLIIVKEFPWHILIYRACTCSSIFQMMLIQKYVSPHGFVSGERTGVFFSERGNNPFAEIKCLLIDKTAGAKCSLINRTAGAIVKDPLLPAEQNRG